ncbi:hypothetical protein KHQ89_05370 [Mycoplasmatota bacterium]|nr:hypothetical protein KHQ89_05370 [Mycoplasmatota bacterium]
MNLGCDEHLNKDIIKHFQSEYKLRVKEDKIYDSIYKSFSKELNLFIPFFKQQSDLEKKQKSLFLQRQDLISQDHQILSDKYIRAYDKIIDKNSIEINDQHQLLLEKHKEIQTNYQLKLEHIQSERISLKNQITSQINDAKTKVNRRFFEIEQNFKSLKAKNLDIVDEIEKEFKLTEENIQNNFEKTLASLQLQQTEIVEVKEQAINENKASKSLETTKNNTYYINIKKTFNDANVNINEKINVLNKTHQRALSKLEKSRDKNNDPILEEKIESIKQNYASQLEAFDLSFEEVLKKYEDKKEKMLHEFGESISIYNSKLTNNKETIEEEKLKIVREHRNQMKDLNDAQQQMIAKKMKKQLNMSDNELNKMIIQTQKDISEIKRSYQQRTSQLENNYLRNRYEWRLNKLLLTNTFHNDLKKIEINYQYNLESARSKYQLNESQFAVKKEILLQTLNQDILPLDTQMMLQNLVQERELNLLNNDQQIALNQLKIELLDIEKTFEIAHQELIFLENKNAQELSSEILVLNSNTQLELEKAKIQREAYKEDFMRRKTLLQSSFDYQQLQLNHRYNIQNINWMYEEQIEDIDSRYSKFLAKRKETLIYHKRSHFMRDADVKTKSRIQQNASIKSIRDYKNDIISKQYYIESLTSTLLFCYTRLQNVNAMIGQLYRLPAHPDVFKSMIDLFKQYVEQINLVVESKIENNKDELLAFINTRKNDISHHKHALKHETFQFFSQNNIDQYDIDIDHFEQEIKYLESMLLIEQASIEKHQAFVAQLEKIKQQVQSNDDTLDRTDNEKLIKRHIIHIKASQSRNNIYEQEIRKHRRAQSLLEYRKQKIKREMNRENRKFERRTKVEMKQYDQYGRLILKVYQRINRQFKTFASSFNLYNKYIDNNVFMTDKQISDVMNNFDKKSLLFSNLITVEQQNQQVLVKRFYMMHLDQEALLIQDIKEHEKRSLSLLKKSSDLYRRKIDHELKKQEHMTRHARQIEKNQLDDEIKTQEIQYLKSCKKLEVLIKHQEDVIQKANQEIELQLQTINQNQHEIALQYLNDTQEKDHALEDQYQKNLKQVLHQYDKKIDDFNHLNMNLEKKNQALLLQYQANEKSLYDTHTSKLNHFKQKSTQNLQKINQLENSFNKKVKQELKTRNTSFRLLQKDLKSKNKQTTTAETKIFNQDVKEERASLRFKLKSLKINK